MPFDANPAPLSEQPIVGGSRRDRRPSLNLGVFQDRG